MNLISVILKIIFDAGLAGTSEIATQVLSHLRKLLRTLVILLITSVTLCVLLGYLIDRVLTQIDTGSFAVTNSINFLCGLVVANVLAVVWALRSSAPRDRQAVRIESRETGHQTSPIETAVAAFILSFIKDRDLVREDGTAQNLKADEIKRPES
ncbi:MAG TPA: hypothetical protein VNJ01_13415 [Bacteriovoracaceae bacterium]|nr:hypothetical protein [Bacteriovoracaceae bacterium]